MYRYVDGGQRHLFDEWEPGLDVLDRDGTLLVVDDVPDDEAPPDYPSPAGS